MMISSTCTKPAMMEMKMRNSRNPRLIAEASMPKVESHERAPSPVMKACTHQLRVPPRARTRTTAMPRPLAVDRRVEHAR